MSPCSQNATAPLFIALGENKLFSLHFTLLDFVFDQLTWSNMDAGAFHGVSWLWVMDNLLMTLTIHAEIIK